MDPLVIITFVIIVILIILGWILYKNTRPTCTVSGSKCNPSLPCCKSSDGCYSNVCSDTCEYDTKKFLAFCKPDGTDPTCEEYAICEQRTDKPSQSCSSNNWFDTNCNNWKPSAGAAVISGNTATWSGSYYLINTQNLGGSLEQHVLPNIDLNIIDTLILNIDFSNKYARNTTGTFITIGLVTGGMTVDKISTIIKTISVDISDSSITSVPFPASYPGKLFQNSQVYLFDSTIIQTPPIINLVLNTNTDLTNKNITFTIHFNKNEAPTDNVNQACMKSGYISGAVDQTLMFKRMNAPLFDSKTMNLDITCKEYGFNK